MRTVIPKNAKLIPQNAERVFKGIIYDVHHWQQQMFDGSYETFEMLKRPDTIKVLAIKDDKIVVIEEEQPARDPIYDLPGGRHDVEGESELEAAKREVLEETGMTFKNWKLLDVRQPHTKIDYFVYIFLATDFENQVKQKLDVGEKISIELFDFGAFKQLIDNSKARYLRESKDLYNRANTLEDLINLPEYKGE